MFFYFRQAIDQNKHKKSLTLFRHARTNIKQQGVFGNYRAQHGLEAAMPLFRKISFSWEKAKTSIGDIMSGSIFSARAAEIIKALNINSEIFEPIDIEGTPAFYIAVAKIDGVDDKLDMFWSRLHPWNTVVSQRFKDAWEAAGLLGAEFEALVGQPTPYRVD